MIRRIIALNNMGVESLRRGDLLEAARLFRRCVDSVKTNLGNAPGAANDEGSNNNAAVGSPLIRCPLEFFPEANIRNASPHNLFEIFPCAFGLQRSNGQSTSNAAPEILVALLFNLGLTHHLAGFMGQGNARENLTKALSHYKLCMDIFDSYSLEFIFDYSFCALLCGNCTNSGHILAHLGRLPEAVAFGEYLESLLESTACTTDLTEEENDFFYTIMYCSKHSCNVAAAA